VYRYSILTRRYYMVVEKFSVTSKRGEGLSTKIPFELAEYDRRKSGRERTGLVQSAFTTWAKALQLLKKRGFVEKCQNSGARSVERLSGISTSGLEKNYKREKNVPILSHRRGGRLLVREERLKESLKRIEKWKRCFRKEVEKRKTAHAKSSKEVLEWSPGNT